VEWGAEAVGVLPRKFAHKIEASSANANEAFFILTLPRCLLDDFYEDDEEGKQHQ
jgi:hypothetical protein